MYAKISITVQRYLHLWRPWVLSHVVLNEIETAAVKVGFSVISIVMNFLLAVRLKCDHGIWIKSLNMFGLLEEQQYYRWYRKYNHSRLHLFLHERRKCGFWMLFWALWRLFVLLQQNTWTVLLNASLDVPFSSAHLTFKRHILCSTSASAAAVYFHLQAANPCNLFDIVYTALLNAQYTLVSLW